MTLPTPESAPRTSADPRQILDWLAQPVAEDVADELDTLRLHLSTVRDNPPPPVQLHKLLDLLHDRALKAARKLIPELFHVRLPIAAHTRRTARCLQDVLEIVAREYLGVANDPDQRMINGLRRPSDQIIWRAMHALHRHLFVANLLSAPATPGIWQQLHLAMTTARRLQVEQHTPDEGDCSILTLYKISLLLGCAHSSAFTAHEWSSLERYATTHAGLIDIAETAPGGTSCFWLDPEADGGPIAASRRPVLEATRLVHFSCEPLLRSLDEHRSLLAKGVRPSALGFPDDLTPRLARTLLNRMRTIWGDPRKRRFPRRRQGYRARLCIGFHDVWGMLHGPQPEAIQPSEWIVTNESPDGYSIMHVTGRPQKVQIGDLVALRSDDTAEWQICIVRWALSENPEHLELGLQVLSARAVPATLAVANQQQAARQPVLLMPAVPPLRTQQTIATVPGLLLEDSGKLVLLVETGKVEVREVKVSGVQEQSADADVFSINPDRSL